MTRLDTTRQDEIEIDFRFWVSINLIFYVHRNCTKRTIHHNLFIREKGSFAFSLCKHKTVIRTSDLRGLTCVCVASAKPVSDPLKIDRVMFETELEKPPAQPAMVWQITNRNLPVGRYEVPSSSGHSNRPEIIRAALRWFDTCWWD